jgi:D-alanyl-D-alanine carboxypeptidase (penicillin-binding protein 5/6)
MKNSSFRNASGLPDPQHFTTARDLSILAGALIRDFPEEYRRYYSMKDYSYNNIKQPNRNRLLWIDSTVDGLKTGHTEAAGYCLISSAQRGPRRLLSVLLGADSDASRTSESLKLLNWGFLAYDAVALYTKNQAISSLRVWKGAQNQVKAGFENDLIIAVPKGLADKIVVQLISQQPLMAPVRAGQQVATLRISIDGKAYGDYPVSALETVPVAGVVGRALDSVKLWFN